MISDLIKQEMETFFEEEIKRQKEREELNTDPVLKKFGITKNYMQLVENALAEKDLDKAKAIRDEIEGYVAKITDADAKDKLATIGIEVNNLIDLEEKIRKNKKDFELKINNLQDGNNKGFFSEKSEKKEDERIKHIFEKGITESKVPAESFFMAKPDKVTVVQNIITPDQPIPTRLPTAEEVENARKQEMTINTPPVIAQMPPQPIQIMPERIKAEIVRNPKEGHEKEFSSATFIVQELNSYIKEKELQKAKDEYNNARNLIQNLPDCDEKEKLMKDLFDDYHSIKELERERKIIEEEQIKRKAELQKQKQIEEHKKALQEQELNKRKAERHKEEYNNLLAHKSMSYNASGHFENSKKSKEDFEENRIGKEVIPPQINREPKSHKDVQQRILEAKHEQIKSGGNNTAKFLQIAQESLNKDRALKLQRKNEEISEKKINFDFNTSVNDSTKIYNKAVSMIYEGKKQEAKNLLIELLKIEPNNMAAQIRLKECEL